VPRDRERDAGEIDALGVDPIRQRHQHRHGQDIGAVEGGRDPARLAVAQAPERGETRQQRRPEEGADLHQHLRGADQRDQLLRRDAADGMLVWCTHRFVMKRSHGRGKHTRLIDRLRGRCKESE
jgi:hypothetical protein